MRSRNNGAQYFPFPKSSTGSVEEYHEPALDFGSPKKKKELLDALGYDSPHVEQHFTGGASLDFDKHPSNERAEDTKDEPSEWKPPRPSMRLLFSLCTTRDFFFHILPCIIFSLGGGAIPPIMTLLVGDAFGAFSSYPADVSQATSEQRSELMKSIGHSCLIFFIVGLAGWVVNTLMLTYWTRLGEVIANRLRAEVYRSVMARGMEWFDLGMGFKEDASGNLKVKEDGEEAGVGAGGLMAKFTRQVWQEQSSKYVMLIFFPLSSSGRQMTSESHAAPIWARLCSNPPSSSRAASWLSSNRINSRSSRFPPFHSWWACKSSPKCLQAPCLPKSEER
jgi:ATP-binding cassette subfamily B (MDR/TAP) protein 1